MLYCSLHVMGDGCNCYFSFWVIFAHLPSPLPAIHSLRVPKIKMKKKMKKMRGDIIILHMCTKNYSQMMYRQIWCTTDRRTDGQTEKVTYRGE